jgi:ribokinase
VVGSINVDLIVSVESLPTPGETALGERANRHGGGKGANAAVAAARLGARVRLIGAVGDDSFGRDAVGELTREGVDVQGVARISGETTGAALIVVDASGENQIAVGAGANGALTADRVLAAVADHVADAGCFLVSLEIPDGAVMAAVTAGREAGVPVIVNPAPARRSVLETAELAPIFTPNAGEARILTGERDLGRAARELCRRSGAPVVVTDGARGAHLQDGAGSNPVQIPAPAGIPVVDTTGAGDAFSAAFAVRLASGDTLRDAVRFAVAASACSVRSAGARAGMPAESDVRELMS